VAIDVARTAVRLGCPEVHLSCLERREEMPAFPEEIEAAEDEGVIIHNSSGPKRIVGEKGRAVGVEFLKCRSVFDSDGKFNPRFREGSEFIIPTDTVIVAIGQLVDWTLLKAADGLLETTTGAIQVDDVTLATNIPGIFAGGDVVGGSELAIDAIVHGHEAAISIDRYLRGMDLKEGRGPKPEVKLAELPERKIEPEPRVNPPLLPVKDRIKGFDEVEIGYSADQAVEEAKRCLNCGICAECLECVNACGLDAIDHSMRAKTLKLNAGAIILSPGFDTFEAGAAGEYGYGLYSNVITSLEFERILSASGPYQGHVQRPSDGKEPGKLAFIQCVGSRNLNLGKNYCSAVCCMYATKEAIVAKEHVPGLETTIFYTDIRAFGKGFYRYYERAKKEYGVRYIRSSISSVKQMQRTKNLLLRYINEDGSVKEEEFDLVVLSVGVRPPEDMEDLCHRLSVKVDGNGFCETDSFNPVETSRKGIYVCGAFAGPRDIPETVMSAGAAASCVGELLSSVRGTVTSESTLPEEIDVTAEEPRIGVFICHCGINIGGVVNVPEVVEYAKTLPNVVVAEENLFTCSPDAQESIKEKIKEHKLNRVFV
ncbi:MAG: FAD-dependent oxidoreductase, partial [Fidelibacterota bacterium]